MIIVENFFTAHRLPAAGRRHDNLDDLQGLQHFHGRSLLRARDAHDYHRGLPYVRINDGLSRCSQGVDDAGQHRE
jgi:hypothetical protein